MTSVQHVHRTRPAVGSKSPKKIEATDFARQRLRVPLPHREKDRLQLLQECDILDTPPEESYDQFTALTSRIFKVSFVSISVPLRIDPISLFALQVPISLISLVDAERQWFKARVGLSVEETHRNFAFCSYAILEETSRVMVVEDATKDARFALNPLVTGSPHIRFYAGASLIVNGTKVGVLCLVDQVPRFDFDERKRQNLEDFADIVSEMMASRRQYSLDSQYQGIHLQQSVLTMIQSPLGDLKQSFSQLQSEEHRLLQCCRRVGAEAELLGADADVAKLKKKIFREAKALDDSARRFASEMMYFQQLLELSLSSVTTALSQDVAFRSSSSPRAPPSLAGVVVLNNSYSAGTEVAASPSASLAAKSPCSRRQIEVDEPRSKRLAAGGLPPFSHSTPRASNRSDVTDMVVLALATTIAHVLEKGGAVDSVSLPSSLADVAAAEETSSSKKHAAKPWFIKVQCAFSPPAHHVDARGRSVWLEEVTTSPLMDTVTLLAATLGGTMVFHPTRHFFGLEIHPYGSSRLSPGEIQASVNRRGLSIDWSRVQSSLVELSTILEPYTAPSSAESLGVSSSIETAVGSDAYGVVPSRGPPVQSFGVFVGLGESFDEVDEASQQAAASHDCDRTASATPVQISSLASSLDTAHSASVAPRLQRINTATSTCSSHGSHGDSIVRMSVLVHQLSSSMYQVSRDDSALVNRTSSVTILHADSTDFADLDQAEHSLHHQHHPHHAATADEVVVASPAPPASRHLVFFDRRQKPKVSTPSQRHHGDAPRSTRQFFTSLWRRFFTVADRPPTRRLPRRTAEEAVSESRASAPVKAKPTTSGSSAKTTTHLRGLYLSLSPKVAPVTSSLSASALPVK